MNENCPICRGIGWVCENHPDKPYTTSWAAHAAKAYRARATTAPIRDRSVSLGNKARTL